MGKGTDAWQGTLSLMVLKTLETMARDWQRTTGILARFLSPESGS